MTLQPPTWTTIAPPPPPRRRPVGLIVALVAAIVIAVAAVTVGLVYLATSRPATVAALARSAPAQPTTSPPGSPAAPTTTAPANPVKDWVLGGGAGWMSTITEDFTAASSGGQTELRAGCVKLGQDVRSAQAYPPIPDAQAQADWSAALTQYAKGATDCMSGVDRHSSSTIARATSEFQTGQTHFQAVLDRLNALAP